MGSRADSLRQGDVRGVRGPACSLLPCISSRPVRHAASWRPVAPPAHRHLLGAGHQALVRGAERPRQRGLLRSHLGQGRAGGPQQLRTHQVVAWGGEGGTGSGVRGCGWGQRPEVHCQARLQRAGGGCCILRPQRAGPLAHPSSSADSLHPSTRPARTVQRKLPLVAHHARERACEQHHVQQLRRGGGEERREEGEWRALWCSPLLYGLPCAIQALRCLRACPLCSNQPKAPSPPHPPA